MICLNCKKQIPDDSKACPHCGVQVSHKEQVGKEISFRRWQRWFFYGVIIVMFLGMVGLVVKFYSSNSELLLEIANVRGELTQNKQSLSAVQLEINKKKEEYQDLEDSLKKENEGLKRNLALETEKLTIRTSEFAKELAEKEEYKGDFDNCLVDYSILSDNYKNLISSIAVGITDNDLNKIMVADFNLDTASDTDKDGLSDMFELAIGTNPNLMDSDSDGYSDRAEILSGFDPNGNNNFSIDNDFAAKNKGRVFFQVENGGYAWYVGKDLKRYFLGKVSE